MWTYLFSVLGLGYVLWHVSKSPIVWTVCADLEAWAWNVSKALNL